MNSVCWLYWEVGKVRRGLAGRSVLPYGYACLLVSPTLSFPLPLSLPSPSHILPGHKEKRSALPHRPTILLRLKPIPETEPADGETETPETMSQVSLL